MQSLRICLETESRREKKTALSESQCGMRMAECVSAQVKPHHLCDVGTERMQTQKYEVKLNGFFCEKTEEAIVK